MSNLKNIVPPLELCKQIPEGEFGDSALVWVVKGDHEECAQSTMFNAIPNSWKVFPAPTPEEIIIDIGKTHKHPVLTYSHDHWEITCYTGYTNAKLFWIKFEPTASDAALRLWFKVKGIEVK